VNAPAAFAPSKIESLVAQRFAAGHFSFGQVLIVQGAGGSYQLCHGDDAGRVELKVFGRTEDVAEIARYDEAGNYRPLKTAPNLRHGWRLDLPDLNSVIHALDAFYPGRFAVWLAYDERRLIATPLRETLGRQTGMYRAASKINEEQADRLIGRFCRSDGGCLRTILWRRDAAGTLPSRLLPTQKFDPVREQGGEGQLVIPLLCQEACNLLVAEARKLVKAERPEE